MMALRKEHDDPAVGSWANKPIKKPRHVVIAQAHLVKQRDKLTTKIDAMTKERDGINEAIAALEGKE